ncbi:sugar transferase [Aureispira anguillae]|uniref:Sugar transferase n=1 Tax=Aureispira anguillae TaxID=2864201 RepID=A0A916DVX3_9BACT|nr:sugar transferase [Aureispira anguillae]BDS15594.1 sugar transferase [Aureispira anguillae]
MMPVIQNQKKVTSPYIPLWKRIFDLSFSLIAIVFLAPLFLIIGLLIKLDSKGSVFYISKRVGSGYQVFNFYKFRTMRTGADNELEKLRKELNQYEENNSSENDNKAVFVKLKQDPRVTRLGKFLRKTSLDELPQLFNIIKGDMSIVGNRPLPLYEAEQLMTDYSAAQRFEAPAGLTGLWQVQKRGQSDMSEEERKCLDNEYAKNYTFWMDIKLIIQTFKVFIQKENV